MTKRYNFKKTILILFSIFMILCLSACEYSNEVINVTIGKFPDRIVYIADVDTELDLTGCTMIIETRDRSIHEQAFVADQWCKAVHNVDFSTAGVYDVSLMIDNEAICRIPVQVVDMDFFEKHVN